MVIGKAYVPCRSHQRRGHRDRPEGNEEVQDRACPGRQERLLLPDPLSEGDDSRPFPWPMMSTRRNGSTRPPAVCATFPGRREGSTGQLEGPGYTFNTACYSCHVSQLSTNYDLKTDTYHTTWAEPGINCETCHGPSAEHNRVMKETPKGQQPKDLKIISAKKFTPEQHNATCSGCHAKMSPLTASFHAGRPVLRPLRSRDPGGPRLLPRRP